MFEKKCGPCGRRIKESPVNMYSATFCSKEHVASYFGDYVDETWDEVYWSDFY